MITNTLNLARRSIDALANDPDQEPVHFPKFAVFIFLLTCIVFMVSLFAISYTYGHIIPTLCMIESPATNAYVPVSNIAGDAEEPPAYEDDESADGVPKPPTAGADEVLLVRNKPLTASLRATILHLRARGGFWSRFRGFAVFIVWSILRNIFTGFLSFASDNVFALAVASIVAEVLLAHIHMTWIHVVISEPSTKRWYQRLPKPILKSWRKIAPAVALWAVASHLCYLLPMLVVGARADYFRDPEYQPDPKELYLTMAQMTGAMLLTVVLAVLVQIPATVTMVRVAASMLPEEDETIVPFDRTYGGKTTPAIVGGEGKIGLVEAWKTFSWPSRKRLLILCVKVASIMVAAWMIFVAAIVLQAHLLFGTKAFAQLLKELHGMKGWRVD